MILLTLSNFVFTTVAFPLMIMDSRTYRTVPMVIFLGALVQFSLLILLDSKYLVLNFLTGLIGFFILWVVGILLKGRLGGGDALFSGLVGICLGPVGLWFSLFLGCILGFLTFLWCFFIYRGIKDIRLPFISLMGLGGLIYLCFEQKVSYLLSLHFF